MSRPLRLALLGAGHWGRVYLRTLASLPEAAVTRVASRNPETQGLVPEGCRVHADWREAVAAEDVDAVIVAAPPALHAEMATAALEAGLPVMVEKPLTMDPGEARALLELADKRRGLLLVDHIHLFHPAYEALKREARALGKPKRLVSLGGSRGPFRPDTPPLWDYGPHDLSLCLDFMGKAPAKVSARVERAEDLPEGRGENWAIELGFPGGCRAEIKVGNLFSSKQRRFEAHYARQALVIDDLSPHKLERHPLNKTGLGPGKPVAVAPELPLVRAAQAFLSAVRSGSHDLASLRLGVSVVELLSHCASVEKRAY